MRKWMFPKKDELTEEELYGQEREKIKGRAIKKAKRRRRKI